MAGFGASVSAAVAVPGFTSGGGEDRRFLDEYEYVKVTKGPRQYFQCLGSGGFGVVFRARRRTDGAILAAKRMHTDDVAAATKIFNAEVKRLREISAAIAGDPVAAASIIAFVDGFLEVDAARTSAFVYIVMEESPIAKPWDIPVEPAGAAAPTDAAIRSVTGGNSYGSGCDMTGNAVCEPPLSLTQGRYVVWQLLSGLAFLHSRGLIHRDVKPENLLVFGSARDPATGEVYPLIKISDFGLCRAIDPDAVKYTVRVGTKSYRAPETQTPRYDNKVDVFSAGATFFSLVMASVPSDRVDLGFPKRFENVDHAKLLATFPVGSTQLDFLARMTQADPRHRMSANEALEHPFLSGLVPGAVGDGSDAAGGVSGGAGAMEVADGDESMA